MKKRKLKKKILLIPFIIILIPLLFLFFRQDNTNLENNVNEDTNEVEEYDDIEKQLVIDENGLSFVDGILIVNKHHALPREWAPGEDPRALEQLNALITEMRALGFDICTTFSGFRSFERQETLYNNFVAQHGREEADRFSARPGHSEHQSGLAFDLRHRDGSLVTRTAEADWIATNAHRFGFIVRYPAESEHITGFIHEPWHLRYIGERAEEIWRSGLTLEEFLGLDPAPDYLN